MEYQWPQHRYAHFRSIIIVQERWNKGLTRLEIDLSPPFLPLQIVHDGESSYWDLSLHVFSLFHLQEYKLLLLAVSLHLSHGQQVPPVQYNLNESPQSSAAYILTAAKPLPSITKDLSSKKDEVFAWSTWKIVTGRTDFQASLWSGTQGCMLTIACSSSSCWSDTIIVCSF